jgi:signal transduction histidine kinase
VSSLLCPGNAGRVVVWSCGRVVECMSALESSLLLALAALHRLQQCLTALVDNALLYTDSPVILTASSGTSGELVLHLRGSGIGLSVVRLLIEAMGGRVQVADHPRRRRRPAAAAGWGVMA